MASDHVSRILAQWAVERPDIDPSPMALVGRLSRLTRDVESKIEANFTRQGLQGGRFDLLATLRRNGSPYTLNPTQLQAQMMLSSGATTHRIDLLEREGLVERLPDPTDRRGTLVRLTPEGLRRVDAAVAGHAEVERQWLSVLSAEDQGRLTQLLADLAAAQGL